MGTRPVIPRVRYLRVNSTGDYLIQVGKVVIQVPEELARGTDRDYSKEDNIFGLNLVFGGHYE